MRLLVLGFLSVAFLDPYNALAQVPAYAPLPGISGASDLRSFAAQSTTLNGRWSSGNCAVKWYDWSAEGLEISFRDQTGKLDIERVIEVQPGGFVTQSIAANHKPTGAFWRYQLIASNKVRVQNLSSGNVFFQEKCPSSATSGGFKDAVAGTAMSPPGSVSLLGPSFSCDKARDPLSSTICGDQFLPKQDREYSQAYYALRQQSNEDTRQQLRLQAQAFQQRVISECGLPKTGVPDVAIRRRAAPCVAENYRAMRDQYVQALAPDARAEALRSPTEHVALQTALGTVGSLILTEPADGVYGPATRDAIMRFQQSRGLQITGLMSANTAQELLTVVGTGVRDPGRVDIADVPAKQPVTIVTQAAPPMPERSIPAEIVPPQRRPTTASRALAEEGNPDDLLVLANISPDAPNAAIDLSGQLTFPSGKAALCLSPETNLDFDDQAMAGQWFTARKLASLSTLSTCRDVTLNKLDGVLTARRSIGRLEVSLFNDVAERLQAGVTRAFVIVPDLDRRAGRDQRELARAATEQAVSSGRPGFGYATLANASATACVVVNPAPTRAWEVLLEEQRGDISLDLGRLFQPKPQVMDADTAYIGGRRGNCAIIVATADQLAAMFRAFQRDQVTATYGTTWFPPEMLQNATAALQAGSESAAQSLERARQASVQERELRARREEAEGVRREQDTRQLRATFGANATALRDQIGTEVLSLFKDPNRTIVARVGSTFPDVVSEAARRSSEGWVFAEGGLEVVEYGRSNWSGRSLETEVTRVRMKLKNSEAGRYDDICFDLGYQNDAEFQRTRSSKSFDCKNSGQLTQWLVGLGYESKWNAR